MASESLYFIWLSCALGYASAAVKPLFDRFGDALSIYEASEEDYAEISELCAAERRNLANKDLERAEEIAGYCLHGGIRLLKLTDEDYPAALREIKNPPVLLYCRGRLPDWNRLPCIGVVGARAMSYYGADAACEIAYDLGRMGCITVSGMALGIDGVAAAATLEAGAPTVAVLGSGIDRIYPAAHKTLYKAILEKGGAVITEFAPYEGADGFHFPLRNRVISGIAKAIILVEGDASSGALITARYAKRQGKGVFAVPGKIGDLNSEAPHLLLKGEGKLLTCADDIYDTYKEEYFSTINPFNLLPRAEISVDDVIRRYAIAKGDAKKKEKKLLNQRKGAKKKGVFGKIRSLVGGEKKEDVEKINQKQEENTRQNDADRRERLDEERKRSLSPKTYRVYEKLNYETALHPDEITVTGLSVGEVVSELISMEISGAATLLPGGRYLKSEL